LTIGRFFDTLPQQQLRRNDSGEGDLMEWIVFIWAIGALLSLGLMGGTDGNEDC